jgi:hypothetical protein
MKQLHVIVNNQITTPDALDESTHASLMARPHGDAGTIGDALNQGYPVCVAGDWIVPSPMLTSAGLVDPSALTFATGVDDHENPTAHIEARDSVGTLVHRSGSIMLRKGLLLKDPLVYVVGTEYGQILSTDLEGRNPTPNVQEWWLELNAEQVAGKAQAIAAEREAIAAGNGPEVRVFDQRETVHGLKTYQLVSRSAVA